MAIPITCPGCGRNFKVRDNMAGRKGKCPACGTILTIPANAPDTAAPEAAVAAAGAAAPEPAAPSAPAQETPEQAAPPTPAPSGGGLMKMECKGCGGTIEYRPEQGLFKCKFCQSVYEVEATAGGGVSVTAIKIIEKKLDNIEGYTKTSASAMSEERLQKKAAAVQDKIDYSYIEFENSPIRRLATGAVLGGIVGVVLAIAGLANMTEAAGWVLIVIGGLLVAGAVVVMQRFKAAKTAFNRKAEETKQQELEPIYNRLREIGATMDGGAVSLGFTESTSVPQRYCVCCHKNIVPAKSGGGLGGAVSGMNLALTILTCGAWIPAWIVIALLMKGGGMASRAVKSGACPDCGTKTLFPARIPNS